MEGKEKERRKREMLLISWVVASQNALEYTQQTL